MRNPFALLCIIFGLVALPGLVLAQSFEPDQDDDADRSEELDEDSVTFPEEAESLVGLKIDSEFERATEVRTQVSMQGQVLQDSEQRQSSSRVDTIDVLEVGDEGEIRAMRITVHKNEQLVVEGPREREMESDTVGRIYHVTRNNDTWDVAYCETDEDAQADEDGASVPMQEEEAVREIAENASENNMASELAGNTYEVGDEVEIDPDDFFGEEEQDFEDREFKLVFAGLSEVDGRRVATFDVTMNMAGTINPDMNLTMRMESEGTMVVDVATMITLSLEVEGPVRLKGGDDHIDVDGEGIFEMNGSSTLSRNDD